MANASKKYGAYDHCEDVPMAFGKHRDRTLRDILADDAGYLNWLNDQAWFKARGGYLQKAVAEMCAKYESEIQKAIDD